MIRDLDAAEVRALDVIHQARWAHRSALDPVVVAELVCLGLVDVHAGWVRLTPAAWDLYAVAA